MSAPEALSPTLADPAPTLADRRQPGAGPATTGNNGLIDELLGRLTLEQKVELITGASFWTTAACPEIGLRSLTLSDGPAGVRGRFWSEQHPSAALPNAVCLAATFDPELVERAGRLIGSEARRNGVDVLLGPTVNLHRSPHGGRNFEAFSEDAVLTAQTGGALVDGIQSQGVAATAKHFIGNDSETERMTLDAVIDEATLRSTYALPFEELVVDHDVAAVMSSYNSINGTSGTESPLLESLLRAEWGFASLVISDWGAVRSVEAAAVARTDLAMPGPESPWSEGLVAAVRDGRVDEADVDVKVASLLGLAARLGALSGIPPRQDPTALDDPHDPSSPAVRDLLATIAARGAVLLRNEGATLPLEPSPASIAVIGPAATRLRVGGGGSATVVPPHVVSVVTGIEAAFPDALVHAVEGVTQHRLLRPIGDRSTNDLGAAGYDVELLDLEGTVLAAQARTGGELIYGMGFPDGVDGDLVTRIRVTMTLHETGPRRIGVAGIGDAEIWIEGQRVAAQTLRNEHDDEIAGLSRPPQLVLDISLTGGERVVIEFAPAPDTIAALRIGLEGPARSTADLLEEAVAAARAADVAVVVVGTTEAEESEGFDRESLSLGADIDALVEAVAAVNPRTVVVLNVGAPVLLPWRERVAAILLAHFPGQEGGTAIGRILAGAEEPGGRLPSSWPRTADSRVPSVTPVAGTLAYQEGEAFGYRDPEGDFAFVFGDGLGFTTWSRSPSSAALLGDGSLRVSASVENTGSRRGRQPVLVFVAPAGSPEALRFAGSTMVDLAPGTSTVAEVVVPSRRLRRLLPSPEAGLVVSLGFSVRDREPARIEPRPVIFPPPPPV
ncbi:MAG TPA: glycoside hydrolase family 3 C-terminal domain-containing protein [Dermatophilaceae bacterium]|jgi:beta-glucosidase|nr:glycoside hydrolase family 3 C-terminal domain-containing protein [Dermatophilaceae bacterium]HOR16324.1 glycoside hydrolase family 3 C-terminal domain-containing protein [Dermatophilaceae bacterium]HPK89522.1 glycoside hydrolase family 3 C-terminal domain-containing protein [Dermatophilaceae bacterium]HQH90759.1 glycoside hydrolase family 3 C-terminal domain-containing protein [Dermatophilaceae bacterium]